MRGILTASRSAGQPAFASRPASGDGVAATATLLTSVAEESGPDSIDLAQSLPANTALLIVTKTTFQSLPSFQLYFHYRGVPQSATKDDYLTRQRQDLSISLAELTTQHRSAPRAGYWRDAYGKVRNWWTGMYPLTQWLGSLVDATDDPQLVVWDDTDYEIPWELFYRDPRKPGGGTTRGGWLGALIPVTRWTTIAWDVAPWHYATQARISVGKLLIMEDLEHGQEGARDEPFDRYLVLKRFGGLRQMLIELDKDDLGHFGLAIIHAHGIYSRDASQYTLGGVSRNELDEYTMAALARSGAIVLLNACASGRPAVSPVNPGAVPRSFVEVFLRSGASGVIATAADIDINQSYEFAIRLVNSAHASDLNIAAALRAQRADYAAKALAIRAERDRAAEEHRRPLSQRTMSDAALAALDKKVEDTYKWFFAWFSYLFFGHPATTLRVAPTGQAQEPAPHGQTGQP